MAFEIVGQGSSLDNITPLVSDFQLLSGDQVLVTIETPAMSGYLFNAAGVENLFSAPESMFIKDVYGDSNHGYILMEATSPMLGVVLAAIPVWAWITLAAGVAISMIALSVTVAVQIGKAGPTTSLLLIGAVALGAVYILSRSVK